MVPLNTAALRHHSPRARSLCAVPFRFLGVGPYQRRLRTIPSPPPPPPPLPFEN